MTYKSTLIGLGLALSLSACATYQENPNYKYSSKYEGPQATQMATNTTPQTQTVVYSDQAPVSYQNRAIPAGTTTTQAPIYIEDAPIADPFTSSPVSTASTSISQAPATAPTDAQYADQALEGTPGYGVYAPETVEYDYADNVVTANAPVADTAAPPSHIQSAPIAQSIAVPQAAMTGNYIVKPGDTVYSLSRNLCVGLADITGPNALGSDYAINIGQPLQLPASRC